MALEPIGVSGMENGRRMATRMFCVLASLLASQLMLGPKVFAALQFVSPPTNQPIYGVAFNQISAANPSYTISGIPNVGSVTVSFGTLFKGQAFGVEHNSLVDTTPSNPLMLDYSKGTAMTMFDLAKPKGLVLGGNVGASLYTAPLAILFDKNVNHVMFDLGHLDPNSPTLIEAFDRAGNSLGTLGGLPTGFSSLALADSTKKDIIAGVSIYVPDHTMDWEGFGVSNLRFSIQDGNVNGGGDPQVPEPAAWIVWTVLAAVGGTGLCWMHRKTAEMNATHLTGSSLN